MKKTIMLAVACAIGGIGLTAAPAQMSGHPTDNAPGNHREMRSQDSMQDGDRMRDADRMRDGDRMNDRDDRSANWNDRDRNGMDNRRAMPPRHWTKGRMAWSNHARRCAARYRSYNPRTDRYMIRAGVSRRCML